MVVGIPTSRSYDLVGRSYTKTEYGKIYSLIQKIDLSEVYLNFAIFQAVRLKNKERTALFNAPFFKPIVQSKTNFVKYSFYNKFYNLIQRGCFLP